MKKLSKIMDYVEICIESGDYWIEIYGESNELPNNKIDELIRKSNRFLGKFSKFEILRIKPGSESRNIKLYDYMMDHPRLEELIKIEIKSSLDNRNPVIYEKFIKCAADVVIEELCSSRDEFEEFLAFVGSRKSARNV
jgi:hypothetical protein